MGGIEEKGLLINYAPQKWRCGEMINIDLVIAILTLIVAVLQLIKMFI
jgi:hypothetical protein